MDNYIFDGEPHALNSEYGYLIKRINEPFEHEKLDGYVSIQLKKFAEYLYHFDKNKVIEYLIEILKSQIFHEGSSKDYEIIYRPAHMVGCLAEFSTLALKFKRSKNDNLEEKSDKYTKIVL
jgi:hypothetical protein